MIAFNKSMPIYPRILNFMVEKWDASNTVINLIQLTIKFNKYFGRYSLPNNNI